MNERKLDHCESINNFLRMSFEIVANAKHSTDEAFMNQTEIILRMIFISRGSSVSFHNSLQKDGKEKFILDLKFALKAKSLV